MEFVRLFAADESAHFDAAVASTQEAQAVASSRFDLVLRSDTESALLVVECKVDASLGESQLRKYHRWLEGQPERIRILGALTPEPRRGDIQDFDGSAFPYWASRVNWSSVHQALATSIDQERQSLAEAASDELRDAESDASHRAAFIVFAEEFLSMLEAEGLVPPEEFDPSEVLLLYRQKREYEKRERLLARHLTQAVERAGIGARLKPYGFDEWTIARGGIGGSKVQSLGSQLRIRFRANGSGKNFLFFGFMFGCTENFEDPRVPMPAEEFRAIAVIHYSGQEARSRLMEQEETPPAERIVAALNAVSPYHEHTAWIPRSTRWHQVVAQVGGSQLTGLTSSEQIEQLLSLFDTFVSTLESLPFALPGHQDANALDLLSSIAAERD